MLELKQMGEEAETEFFEKFVELVIRSGAMTEDELDVDCARPSPWSQPWLGNSRIGLGDVTGLSAADCATRYFMKVEKELRKAIEAERKEKAEKESNKEKKAESDVIELDPKVTFIKVKA